jgi:hypothetical protein
MNVIVLHFGIGYDVVKPYRLGVRIYWCLVNIGATAVLAILFVVDKSR